MAALIIYGWFCSSHITDYVRDYLHRLPVPQHVSFKIATLVYKVQHNFAAWYVADLIVSSTSVTRRKAMPSFSKLSPITPRHHTKFAERAFTVAWPSIWNGLHWFAWPLLWTCSCLLQTKNLEKNKLCPFYHNYIFSHFLQEMGNSIADVL